MSKTNMRKMENTVQKIMEINEEGNITEKVMKTETEMANERIIARIEKVLKQIDPNSKKSIVQLSENEKFKKEIEEIRQFVENYVDKSDFPIEVYDKVAYLVNSCDEQYKELTEKKVELQKQARTNKTIAGVLNEVYLFAITREDFSEYEKSLKTYGLEEYINQLRTISQSDRKSDEYAKCEKSIKSKITNLETNTHIEIDLERIEDKEKVLSYISIELDNVLNKVCVRKDVSVEIENINEIEENAIVTEEEYVTDEAKYAQYENDTVIEVKESLWQKIMNSKIMRTVKEFFGINEVQRLVAGTTNNVE